MPRWYDAEKSIHRGSGVADGQFVGGRGMLRGVDGHPRGLGALLDLNAHLGDHGLSRTVRRHRAFAEHPL